MYQPGARHRLAKKRRVSAAFSPRYARGEPGSQHRHPLRGASYRRDYSCGDTKMDLINLLFSIEGRISRKSFWLFFLSLSILDILLRVLLRHEDAATLKNAHYIFLVVFIYPSIAVLAKRWHDRNKSAAFVFINLIPFVGPLWAIVELGFFLGSAGDNQYGCDPLGRVARPTKVKTYIDSQTTPYLIEFFMFAVLPGGILLFLFRSVLKGDTISAILMVSLLLLLSLPFYFLFRWIRKYRAYKIETYDSGLTYHGLLKKIQSRWDDVLSVKTVNHGLSK
jgi:uncharacterized membrane protein YhaH (DUF805 family)